MSHSHVHTSARRPLAIALGLILGLMIGEVVFGVVAGSLALMADAGHMLTDAAALGLALAAASFAGRPARGRWTFGFRRLALANLADLDPPLLLYTLLFTHPTPPERIAAARMRS